MGYESRIYIVRKTEAGMFYTDMKYGQIIARFDLGKVGYIPCFQKDSEYYIYEGNEAIKKDLYGDTLKQCSLEDIVAWVNSLKRDEKKYELPIKAYITALLKCYDSEDLVAIHYGY